MSNGTLAGRFGQRIKRQQILKGANNLILFQSCFTIEFKGPTGRHYDSTLTSQYCIKTER